MTPVVRDRFGRPVDSLRISVTLRCNHSCVFCHMEGIIKDGKLRELSPEDFGFIAEVLRRYGVRNYKLTGGEPLVRGDIVEIVSQLRPYAYDLSMVTNGSLLKHFAKPLAEAGLDRMNVSLHSLREDVFRRITGGKLKPVLEGIEEALQYGHIIKLDYVYLSWNKGELKDVVNYAASKGLDLNVIELIPIGMSEDLYSALEAGMNPVLRFLESVAVSKKVNPFQNRPTYTLPEGIRVTVILGYGNPYLCAACTRLRMTPDGKFKTCIFDNDNLVDAWDAIKGRDGEGLTSKFLEAVNRREPHFKFEGE
ncbi:MAG: GTP 3',8-cyclase MoaA [Desulfurococcales archaeon]|nr:GTP 3',8-cyclase MoaA [Desulfurococcales archaeon]